MGRRLRRESDRAIVPLKPGNAGGGKDPDFWNAFDDGEDRVIGDEPGNTTNDQERSEKALSPGEGRSAIHAVKPLAWDAMADAGDEASRRAGCGKSARPVR